VAADDQTGERASTTNDRLVNARLPLNLVADAIATR
jgi:hypothetical protein